jgi:hypothetical protein
MPQNPLNAVRVDAGAEEQRRGGVRRSWKRIARGIADGQSSALQLGQRRSSPSHSCHS